MDIRQGFGVFIFLQAVCTGKLCVEIFFKGMSDKRTGKREKRVKENSSCVLFIEKEHCRERFV